MTAATKSLPKSILHNQSIYTNPPKTDLGCAKAPGLSDRNRPNIRNMGSVTIAQSRELSRQPKSDFFGRIGIIPSPMKKLLNRRRQSPGLNDRKRPHIVNIGSFAIVQPRGFRVAYLGVFLWEMVLNAIYL